MTVLRRSAPECSADVDVMLSAEAGDDLGPILDESDVVMIAAGLTDETHHLFSTDAFRRMKDSAILVNMARGAVVDEAALAVALTTGQVGAAGLDVFETEPLPADSPLWDLPNVLVTPHATPQMPDRTQRSVDIVVENVARYRAGEPLLNALSRRDLYTRGG